MLAAAAAGITLGQFLLFLIILLVVVVVLRHL